MPLSCEEGYHHLSKCGCLVELSLDSNKLSNKGLQLILANCKRLSYLRLVDCKSLSAIEDCQSDSLKTLELSDMPVLTSFKPLGFPNLESVCIAKNNKQLTTTNKQHEKNVLTSFFSWHSSMPTV